MRAPCERHATHAAQALEDDCCCRCAATSSSSSSRSAALTMSAPTASSTACTRFTAAPPASSPSWHTSTQHRFQVRCGLELLCEPSSWLGAQCHCVYGPCRLHTSQQCSGCSAGGAAHKLLLGWHSAAPTCAVHNQLCSMRCRNIQQSCTASTDACAMHSIFAEAPLHSLCATSSTSTHGQRASGVQSSRRLARRCTRCRST